MTFTCASHLRRAGATTGILLYLLAGDEAQAAAKGKGSAPEYSVRAVELGRATALLHADTTALSRMTADEFVEVSRFGSLRTKADNMHDIASGELKLATVKYDSLTVKIYGDVAVLRGIADNTGTFRGFPF